MFGRAYLGEIKKLVRPRGLIVLAVLFVIFFIIFAVFYNINFDEIINDIDDILTESGMEGILPPDKYYDKDGNEISADEYAEIYGYINMDYIHLANPDNIDKIIAEITEYYESFKNMDGDEYAQQAGYLKSSLVMLEYMKENNIYGAEINVHGFGDYIGIKSAERFVTSYFAVVFAILVIYGIVLGAGLYADEYRRGTIKLVMLRPISREGLTAAKLLACFTYLVGILGIMSLIAYFYGLIALGSASTKAVYVVFNQSSVFKSTAGGMIFLEMFFSLLNMFAIISLSFMLGTVTKKKTLAIVVTLIIDFGLIAAILSALGLERFLFSTNLDFMKYFGITNTIPKGGNFFIALTMYVVYLAGILAALFLTVKKRDVI